MSLTLYPQSHKAAFAGGLRMKQAPKDASTLEGLLTRIDGLVTSISDRERILSETKSQIEQFQQRTEDLLDQRVAALEAKVSTTLSDQLISTVGYTKELYAR